MVVFDITKNNTKRLTLTGYFVALYRLEDSPPVNVEGKGVGDKADASDEALVEPVRKSKELRARVKRDDYHARQIDNALWLMEFRKSRFYGYVQNFIRHLGGNDTAPI